MTISLSRRQAMALGLGAAGIALAGGGGVALAQAAGNDAKDVIAKFTGGKQATIAKVSLDLPEIAENGNTVPFTVKVDSPMTDADHVTDVLVVADGNPRSGVATFHFAPSAGIVEANTRIRLAQTQNVIAVAKTSKGEFFMASKQVKVTIGGCGG
jgi:sulfur-oxidizing protein SoxY